MFARKKSLAQKAYVKFVSKKETNEVEQFYSRKNLPSMLGGDSFKEWAREKYQHLFLSKEIPESNIFAPSPVDIITQMCNHSHIDRKALMLSKRGEENLPRDIEVYLVRSIAEEPLRVLEIILMLVITV